MHAEALYIDELSTVRMHAARSAVASPALVSNGVAVRTSGSKRVARCPAKQLASKKVTARMQSGPQDWSDVLRAVAERDKASFASLFRHFAPRVKSYMLRLGSDDSQAEDLAQEAMATVWRKAAQYDPARAAASTWIFTIARNLRIDAFRRTNRPELDPEDPALVPDAPPQGDAVVEQKQNAARVHAALAELPEEQRQVLHMSFFHEKTHSEIAESLDLPLGTVKSRIRLAFGRVKASIGSAEE
jgi:RNA polymerase sigma factor (sigma-70 family)